MWNTTGSESDRSMKYFIIAGERSGDLHAGNLASALRTLDPTVELQGWGGDKMESAGVKVVQRYEDMAFMGVWEVVQNLGKIRGFMGAAKAQITAFQPDVLILVDYAGFNMRMAKWAKRKGYRVVYYIAPKAWAWNHRRAHHLRKYTDLTLVIFPFEVPFFAKYGVKVKYVGNPLFDEIRAYRGNDDLRVAEGKRPLVALLPGSRKQEINAMLDIMAKLSAKHPQYRWVVAGVSSFSPAFYQREGSAYELLFDRTYDLLSMADAAVVTSGTATLETALFQVPQVVVYKTSPVTYAVARCLVQLKYISLVNLVGNKEIVKELIQGDYTLSAVEETLKMLLHDNNVRQKQLKEYHLLKEALGDRRASLAAAQAIVALENAQDA